MSLSFSPIRSLFATLALVLGLVLALAAAAPASALDLEDLSDAERAAFRAEVRAYLLENPEVLMEAIAVLEAREQQSQATSDGAMARANADALFNDGYSFVGGNPEGDLTLVEFMDYRCGYCRQAFAEVEELLATDGNIRFIVKEFPILGPQSVMAAQFAVAVQQLHGDDAYKDVHDTLMTFRGDVTTESMTRLANTFGLDPAPIFARMAGPEVALVLDQNRALAQRLEISGTPTFVLEDTMLRGYVPLAQMELIVAGVRDGN